MSSHVWAIVVSLFCLLPLSLVPLLCIPPLPVLCPELQLSCGRDRRALNPMHTRRMRSVAPWRYTTPSQVMSPTSSLLHASMTTTLKRKKWNLLENCHKYALKLYLTRFGRLVILWSVNKLGRSITKWTEAFYKRLSRSISYIHHTCEYKQYCYVGNNAKQCRLGLCRDSNFAGDFEDSKSTSGGTLCVFGSHALVPISWMCGQFTFYQQLWIDTWRSKVRARDRQYSSCLLILWTKVTKILKWLTWMYHVLHGSCIQQGRNIKTRCIGSTLNLFKRKNWSSVKRDRTLSCFTIHSQLVVFRKLFGWTLKKSYTRKYMRHLGLPQDLLEKWLDERIGFRSRSTTRWTRCAAV